MKITLINPYDFSGPGIRSIAAVLREKGHEVQSLFLMLDTRYLAESRTGIDCSKNMTDEILDKCRDSDLVGITLMTSAFKVASSITRSVKDRFKIPVIWGGIHPTISPGECLEYADMVCVGEGEAPILDLVSRMEKDLSFLDVEGLWFKANGNIIKNKIPQLIQDIESLPVDDRRNPNDKVFLKDRFISINHDVVKEVLGRQLTVYTTRGCPYRCSFCCNNVLNSLYKNQRILRYKSPDFIIREIQDILSEFKDIQRVFFQDDSFIVRPLEDLKEFSRLYKKHIDLPFSCQITAPSTNEEKIKILLDAGLNDIRIGLQSASPDILKLYNRPIPAESVMEASRIINRNYRDGLLVSYDLILDNPYEKKEDMVNTLRFLIDLPRPFSLRFYSLQVYPGTQLYTKVMSERDSRGKVRDAYCNSYRAVQGTYLNSLFYLVKLIGLKRCPLVLGKILLRKEMLFLFNNPLVDALAGLLRSIRSFLKYSVFRPRL